MSLVAYALLSAAASVAPGDAMLDGEQFAQMTIRQRVVIRVPMAPEAVAAPPAPIRYKEKKGPKCVAIGSLAGAIVTAPDAIDLVQRGGARQRAQLDKDCSAVDLGYGFYLRPTADGQVCSGRDSIHARTGGQCAISRFRTLVPQR